MCRQFSEKDGLLFDTEECMLETPVGNLTHGRHVSWPPPYRVRFSAKAKQIFLRIRPELGLEVVIPERRKRFNIASILEDKKDWILKMLKKYTFQNTLVPVWGEVQDNDEPQLDLFKTSTLIELPSALHCQAIEETWQIEYEPKLNIKKISLVCLPFEQTLLLKGNIEDKKAVLKLLVRWLMQKAKLHFLPWLNRLSTLTGLNFNHLLIRGQSTLWGSCNIKKNISLNYKLLFLPKLLAEHVLLHELCHTLHLNHSQAFWQTVANVDANWNAHKKSLKTAERYLPQWIGLVT